MRSWLRAPRILIPLSIAVLHCQCAFTGYPTAFVSVLRAPHTLHQHPPFSLEARHPRYSLTLASQPRRKNLVVARFGQGIGWTMSTRSPMADVREQTEQVCSQAKHVQLDESALKSLAAEYAQAFKGQSDEETGWGEEIHFVGKEELTVQYLLVLDAINFCFWPSEGKWEYGDVSGALKNAVQQDESAIAAEKLANLTEEGLKTLLGGKEMPNMHDRARLLREVGQGLLANYEGSAAQMVRSCGGSAAELVRVVITTFPGFRDVTHFNGKEVAFYKRAQIFVGDVWGALKGKGLGEFHDVGEITMFADYRVPQILEARGVLRYSEALKSTILSKTEIPAGAEEEVELRAWTVQAVERLKAVLAADHSIDRMSIQVDWFLWEEGERKAIEGELPPHHRTRTTFY